MILMIDNYDSFTYNLVQYFQILGEKVLVRRNDELTVSEALGLGAKGIVLSPGPGRPEDAGMILELIRNAGNTPLLGVCLGHQAIAMACGAEVVGAQRIMHGKLSEVTHDGSGLFRDIPSPFRAVRYHSLAVREDSLPDGLLVSARAEDGEIMGIRHVSRPLEGIQYHPESILTQYGRQQLKNFLELAGERNGAMC